jgi:hypothetical protein
MAYTLAAAGRLIPPELFSEQEVWLTTSPKNAKLKPYNIALFA